MRSLLATLSLLLLLAEGKARTGSRNAVKHHSFSTESITRSPFVAVRGGATVAEDEDSDVEDEYDEYEDEGEDESKLDPKLTKSAMSSTTKVQAKKTSAAKEAVSAKLKKPRKQSGGLLKALKVPYFVRACMNPFTVVAMTKAYFASLFNLDYLKEVCRHRCCSVFNIHRLFSILTLF